MARKYKRNFDPTGKTAKENKAQRSFWSFNKVEDLMSLSEQELDEAIDKWMADFEARNIKANKSWWYPTPTVLTITDTRNKRMAGIDKKPKIY